jgi:hypothetical protein
VPERLPSPGPSFLREQALDAGGHRLSVGMSRPTITEDEWWLAIVWVADADGIVSFVDLAPAGGPRPEPPLARLGPSLAGGLSGLILEDSGRLCSRRDAPERARRDGPRRLPQGRRGSWPAVG